MQNTTFTVPNGLASAQWHAFKSHTESSQAAADLIQQHLQRALQSNPGASMILSGGSTPGELFDILANTDLDWSRIEISLADERWVGTDSADSNERMIRQRLLTGRAQKARFISLKGDELSANQGQTNCEQRIEQISSPFDVCLLGMGNDGHTASLFPDSPLLEQALSATNQQRCWPMQAPVEPSERMSLGYRPLATSKLLILLLQGQEKYRTLSQALAADDTRKMPIRAFLGLPHLQVFWSP